MIRVAICDDNYGICSEIEKVIIEYTKKRDMQCDIEAFSSGEELIKSIKNVHKYDLIFLDIELGTTTGIEIGTHIREKLEDHISKIIFITSKDGYEPQLFDVQPLNFLKKPIDNSKLEHCLDLAVKLLGMENQKFEYQKNYDIKKVYIKDILYFEKSGKKIKIVTVKGEDFFYQTLDKIKSILPPIFMAPHGSFLVNMEKIIEINKNIIIMANNEKVPISQRNLKTVRKMLFNSEGEKSNVTF